jgi:antirestriction protein ArdC
VTRKTQSPRTTTASERRPFHEIVAEELIQQLEAGTAPWQKAWSANAAIGFLPINPLTGGTYRGINSIHLMAQGRSDSRWLTYKQASAMDAQVKRGERGTQIQYWKFEDLKPSLDPAGKPIKDDNGKLVQIRIKLESPRVFYATVFNAEQIEGLPELTPPVLTWDPVVRAEQILANSGAVMHHKHMDRAYYSPSQDEIHLPLKAQFDGAANYYATALHELAHWSGHETRLKRDLKHPFGSEGYAREELRAEIASLMISSELGLPHDPGQHASYVASWIKVLQKDPLEIFRASADAQKIHTFITGMEPELNQSVDVQGTGDIPLSISERSVPVSIVQRMTEAAVLAEVNNRINQFAHQPTVIVRATAKGVLEGARDGDAIYGAVHNGAIYLFLDQLTSAADVQKTLFHELLHYGLRKIYSHDQFTAEMHKLYQRDASIKAFADHWATTNEGEAAYDFGGANYAIARGVDEALARLAEPNAGEFIRIDLYSKTVQNVTNWLAEVAQSMGFDGVAAELLGIKNQEVRDLIKKVFQRLETDPNPTFPSAWDPTDTAYLKRQSPDLNEPSISPYITKDSSMSSEHQVEKPSNAIGTVLKLSRDDVREAFMHVIDDLAPEQALAIGEAIEFTDEEVSSEIASMILKAREKGWEPRHGQQQADAKVDAAPPMHLAVDRPDEIQVDQSQIQATPQEPSPPSQTELGDAEQQDDSNPRDLYIELNLDGLAKKRARDREITSQEMGLGAEPTDASLGKTSAELMNGVSRAGPSIDQALDLPDDAELGIYQVHQKLASEYQYDGVSKYYFREAKDPQLAFEDRGAEVLTPHHSSEVVGSVAMLVHAKGWRELHLKGTPEFKREMWLQASLLGMKVTGYEPEPIDLVRLNERRDTLSSDRLKAPAQQVNSVQIGQVQELDPSLNVKASSKAVSKVTTPPSRPVDLGAQKAGAMDEQLRAALKTRGADDERIIKRTLSALNQKIVSPRTYVGELLEHGSASYKFDKDEKDSYFVKLRTATGEQTIWGIDLARAIEDLQTRGPVNGEIILAFQGSKAVKTSVRVRDENGNPVGWEPAVVNRNEWVAQSVLDAYALAKQDIELDPEFKAQTPVQQDQVKSVEPSVVETDAETPQVDGIEVAAVADQKTLPLEPSTDLKAIASPQELIRQALDAMGVQDLERETTVTALADVYESPKFHVGTMIEHGTAPYAFQPDGQSSYYARLSTENGEVLIWGVDLARAVRNQVLEGQVVVIAYRGLESIADADGSTTRRNDWLVAPLKKLHEDAQQGVIHAASTQIQVNTPDFSFMDKRDRQSMEVLAQAMRLAKVPDEIAADTLKQAQGLIQSGPKPVRTTVKAPQSRVKPATPSGHRKVGPSL